VVNYEIGIITACFLSTHALSMGCERYVQAVASDVGDHCRWWAWLLKDIICVVFKPHSTQNIFGISIVILIPNPKFCFLM